uniref:Uncharacterized protein n=1 Tax=Arundo donax TaxID=35708 RepID=A0A0A9U914_ARUDO
MYKNTLNTTAIIHVVCPGTQEASSKVQTCKFYVVTCQQLLDGGCIFMVLHNYFDQN